MIKPTAHLLVFHELDPLHSRSELKGNNES